MNRKYTIIVSLCCIALVSGYVMWQMPAKKKYDELASSDLGLSSVEVADEQFLAEVITSWKIKYTECPDQSMTPSLELVGEEPSVQGIVNLYTHDPASFSFTNLSRNKKEALYMATQSVITPITMDDAIHVGEGIAYLRLKEGVVEVYGDTEDGLKSTLYYKP